MSANVEIRSSDGYGKGGRIIKYVRPACHCFNRSRKVSGFTGKEVSEKIDRLISKWYSPVIIPYFIEGFTICSNSKKNALKEFWRICDVKDIGKQFEVIQQ